MSSACGPLSGEQLASEVIRIRAMVLEVTQHRFLGVPFGDLEDAYSRLIEQALAREFPNSGELSAWMLEAMRNDANDVVRSARVRKSVELDEDVEQTLSGPGGPLILRTPRSLPSSRGCSTSSWWRSQKTTG